jgi:L-cysteine/cystine lyase
MSEQRWAWLREQMPVTREWAYMNSGWSGPLSRPVVEAMQRRLDLEYQLGPTTRAVMDDRMALGNEFRDLTARMLGADADEIAIMGNTTEGVNVAVNGLRYAEGDVVVTSNTEHSSGLVPAYYLRERHGAELRIVALDVSDSPGAIVEAYASALGGGRARLVVISEVSYSTGQLLPLKEIVDAAHRAGAEVLVDGAQTAGHIPIDVRATGVDYYAVPSHKWLCGPDGLGALYVRRDKIPTLEPQKVAGRAAASYDYEGGFQPEREKITKFELTTISGVLLAGTNAATQVYLDSGPEAVFARAQQLNRYAERRFSTIPRVRVTGPTTDATRSGLFLFSVEGVNPARVTAFLQQEAKVVCRTVAQFDSVRLSLHCFNTEAEIDRTAECVERAIREGIPDDVTPATAFEAAAAAAT